MSDKVLIFSRDRAMQLDVVLRSFFMHCQDYEQTNIFVLYQATAELHVHQYELLKDAYPKVNFVEQDDFRRDVLGLINPYPRRSYSEALFSVIGQLISFTILLEQLPLRIWQSALVRLRTRFLGSLIPTPPSESQILFLVDDNIFVRDFSLSDISGLIQEHHDAIGFSLRLGSNTTYCYALDKPQSLPTFEEIKPGFLKFDWVTAEFDFSYPLEISSSVYRSKDIFSLIAARPFDNPNSLEYQMAVSAELFSEDRPFLLCPEKSLTFCNPLNLVQTSTPNRSGVVGEYTSERLAEMFEKGYRIQVEKFNGFTPRSCHQEEPLEFYRSGVGAQG